MQTARLIAVAVLGLPLASFADPDYDLFTPNVEQGEREIDFKFGTERFKRAGLRESAASMSLGYGATPWWFTEVFVKYHNATGERTRYDAFEWENRFQLTEHNRYPVDVGFVIEIEVPRQRRTLGYDSRFGPLFQMDTGPLRWNALGSVGKWNRWAPYSGQEHIVGPAIFGRVKLAGRNQIHYNAAYLFKASDAAPDDRFRVQVEYELSSSSVQAQVVRRRGGGVRSSRGTIRLHAIGISLPPITLEFLEQRRGEMRWLAPSRTDPHLLDACIA